MDTGRMIVLLPYSELPHTGVEDALRSRAEDLRTREQKGLASAEDTDALRAIERVLGDGTTEAASEGTSTNGNNPDLPLLLKVTDVASLLGVSKQHAYNLVARGEIPSVRIGKCLRVRRDVLLEWLDELAASQKTTHEAWR